ncbi:hypothetical protein GCG54_00001885 [Colletotrichum gloeosporioides]|uniref:Uncharacterized protein n=1 Tax=Colletotrichum gloeosporioides TaxID=474922 RepID=A0A8H4CXD4_COLGL|nr:uncharacterized protein GCG54_00001885 [Colletotrichum gloeosporioides]KAF3811557.1 hypothetical protein GCG54_00001885 [Colletotrichum gloeosporioides]
MDLAAGKSGVQDGLTRCHTRPMPLEGLGLARLGCLPAPLSNFRGGPGPAITPEDISMSPEVCLVCTTNQRPPKQAFFGRR